MSSNDSSRKYNYFVVSYSAILIFIGLLFLLAHGKLYLVSYFGIALPEWTNISLGICRSYFEILYGTSSGNFTRRNTRIWCSMETGKGIFGLRVSDSAFRRDSSRFKVWCADRRRYGIVLGANHSKWVDIESSDFATVTDYGRRTHTRLPRPFHQLLVRFRKRLISLWSNLTSSVEEWHNIEKRVYNIYIFSFIINLCYKGLVSFLSS